MSIPELKLNNGVVVPSIGFGTCKHAVEKPIEGIILNAIEAGYRYFDTASFYETERDLGRAIKNSGLPRTEFSIATKLWHEEMGYKNTKDACARSLERLNIEYIDFYFVHWPKSSMNDPNWKQTLVETWQALIELKKEGLVKNLGVSNFLPHHLQVIFDNFVERPVIDQLELHLGYFQEYAVSFLQKNGIQPQAWSPIGRGRDGFNSNTILSSTAQKYGVSVQKLSLRFLIQRGVMPLPWSTKMEHIRENINCFDFSISDEDISMLSCMPQETWLGEHPDFYFPQTKHINMNQ